MVGTGHIGKQKAASALSVLGHLDRAVGHTYLGKVYRLCIPRARYLIQTEEFQEDPSNEILLRVGEKMVRSWTEERDSPGQGCDMSLLSVPDYTQDWGLGLPT